MTDYELDVRENPAPGVVLVEVSGELDLTNAADFEHRLDEASGGAQGLVLDLNRVSFIDSAALHVLFRVVGRVGFDRFGIVLEPSATIVRTLGIVGLDDAARIRPTAAELLPGRA